MESKELRALRKAVGLTQQQLAKLSGVSQAQISEIEQGIHRPRATIQRLFDAILAQSLTNQPRIEKREDIRISDRTRAALEKLEALKADELLKVRVLIQSIHHAADWQVVNGLVALYLYRMFPSTLELMLLSSDFKELGALAPTFKIWEEEGRWNMGKTTRPQQKQQR